MKVYAELARYLNYFAV